MVFQTNEQCLKNACLQVQIIGPFSVALLQLIDWILCLFVRVYCNSYKDCSSNGTTKRILVKITATSSMM